MSKKSIIQRQLKRENIEKKFFKKREQIKKELQAADTLANKIHFHKLLEKLPRNSSKVRLRNRCWKTGRGRAVFRDFGLCRHFVRKMANEGFLPGVTKSSW